MENGTLIAAAQWFLRIALAASFLSAVADRFGLWGPAGAPNVAWGAWQPFIDYVAKLNWFVSPGSIPILGWTSTMAEMVAPERIALWPYSRPEMNFDGVHPLSDGWVVIGRGFGHITNKRIAANSALS